MGKKFFGDCGAPLANLCPKCGTDNPSGKRFCGDCARLDSTAPEPTQVEPQKVIHGERRHLTVLFCDLVGSTAITAQLDPEEWHGIAARYQKEAAEAATLLGGHVAKLSRRWYVYFGYPQAHDDDAQSAVRAGLVIIDAISETNRAHHKVELAARVGIHTGQVVMCEVGRSIDVLGRVPNVSSRVQIAAEPNSVLITAVVLQLVLGQFVVEDRGAQTLKVATQAPGGFHLGLQLSVDRWFDLAG